MKNKIYLISIVIALNLNSIQSLGSVTRVGNGDDGSDLERLVKINSGPIIQAKNKALSLLTQLNIMGVPGLSQLKPELENSEIFMASADVHPTTELRGSIEVSDDYKTIYARTFAEPHAATRFFPAAKSLNSDQLVALHIHEALHRALPENIRQNENIVTHFTMAITSQGSSFDRVLEVSKQYVNIAASAKPDEPVKQEAENLKTENQNIEIPIKSKNNLSISVISYGVEEGLAKGYRNNAKLIEFENSPFDIKLLFGQPAEFILKVKAFIDDSQRNRVFLGPLGFEIQELLYSNQQTQYGPFIRYSSEAIDKDNIETVENVGRDIVTVGAIYKKQDKESYSHFVVGYSTESTMHSLYGGVDQKFGSIVSIWGHMGLTYKKINYGALAEVHLNQGRDSIKPFKLLVFGPEVEFVTDSFKAKLFYKSVTSSAEYDLRSLGDILDRGYGRNGLGLTLNYLF